MLDVKLTQICSDKLEYIAETKLGKCADLESASKRASASPLFTSATYLGKAGILRILYRGKSVILFRNGRIAINCVKNVQEASEVFQLIIETLGPLALPQEHSDPPTTDER
jgi:TATA-box binding protein (TBP) (component of TFIID and TFIIIB)